MRVEISDPSLLHTLVDFLTRAEVVARAVAPAVVEIVPPTGIEAVSARQELRLYLLAWQAMNPQASVVALD